MRHKPSFALIGSVVLFAATPAMAQNVPAQLTVTNTAQPGMESDVPQPPVSVPVHGSCDTPFSAQEANSGMSPCAPGSWPPPGGDWSPEVRVAGGDRLTLSFDVPAEDVRYASTTNFPRGLVNPVGQPHPNQDVIAARDAQPTSDSREWSLYLPRFDATGHSPGSGYTFSVVARAGTAWRNFAFLIRSPRWNNHQTRCGYFSNPGEFNRTFCVFDFTPGPPPPRDRTPPRLTVSVPRHQRVLAQRQAIAYARCNEPCTMSMAGRLSIGRRSYKLQSASKRASTRERQRLRAGLGPASARALRRALGSKRQRARVVLSLRARDASGNRSRVVRGRTSLSRVSGPRR